ncbi:MAG: carotenoid 1,2-hydratase [Candidatus Saccharibacteria bacterium]|nr:carotenoid 1,2-hydratase [Pseudorhodobacter sp.]
MGFIGSVFSPWYAWSGRRDPQNHCCINVVTYGPGGRFTMTDRGRTALKQSRDALQVGPSRMAWIGGSLVIDVDEVSALPLISRVRGQIRLTPTAITGVEACLTPSGSHIWRPFAPSAKIEVDLTQGHIWQGHGYFDANFGTAALEADFRRWTWGRFPRAHGGTTCFYDGIRADGSTLALGLDVSRDGAVVEMDPPPLTRLTRTAWGISRDTRCDPGGTPRQTRALLDAPFYSRSLVQTQIAGETVEGVHEALDLGRFRSPLIKTMVAMRVPRRANWP